MIQVKGKKFLAGQAYGLDTRSAPRQVMQRDVQALRAIGFWGGTRFLKPDLRAEIDPRETDHAPE